MRRAKKTRAQIQKNTDYCHYTGSWKRISKNVWWLLFMYHHQACAVIGWKCMSDTHEKRRVSNPSIYSLWLYCIHKCGPWDMYRDALLCIYSGNISPASKLDFTQMQRVSVPPPFLSLGLIILLYMKWFHGATENILYFIWRNNTLN